MKESSDNNMRQMLLNYTADPEAIENCCLHLKNPLLTSCCTFIK